MIMQRWRISTPSSSSVRSFLFFYFFLMHKNSTIIIIIIIAQIFSSIPIYRLFRLRKTKQRGFRAQGNETRGAQGKDLLWWNSDCLNCRNFFWLRQASRICASREIRSEVFCKLRRKRRSPYKGAWLCSTNVCFRLMTLFHASMTTPLNATKESMRLSKQQLTPKWVACTYLPPAFPLLLRICFFHNSLHHCVQHLALVSCPSSLCIGSSDVLESAPFFWHVPRVWGWVKKWEPLSRGRPLVGAFLNLRN